MEFLSPRSWSDALTARAEHPDAVPIAGGTDVMVELNFDRHRPGALIDLTRVDDLRDWSVTDQSWTRLGAGVSYSRIMAELADRAPGLAMAARTVGSPQIRARGTVGGNLGSASPAGDCHPVLIASGARVEVESAARGARTIPADEFFLGVKRSALQPDELISAIHLPPVRGPQQFAKVGTRNAMVIAVTSLGLALDTERQTVGVAIGSAAPTPRRAAAAETYAGEALSGLWGNGRLPDDVLDQFGRLVAEAAAPIDDVRGTADYRRHALQVLARRALTWAWAGQRGEGA